MQRHVEKLNQKSNVVFTWIFDEREDERESGKTVDVNEKYLVLGDKVITILDTPGHKDLVPVMISGASHCDYGLLMVDSEKTSFEHGFNGGQTKEHAKLLSSIGLNGLIVVVNKMDLVNWNQHDFNYVVERLKAFFAEEKLDGLGEVTFIPVSAITGENINKPIGKKASWYTGGTLVDKMSKLESKKKHSLLVQERRFISQSECPSTHAMSATSRPKRVMFLQEESKVESSRREKRWS